VKRQSTAIAITAIFTALLVSSCSESKVSQCNKIIAVANKLEPLGKKLEKDIESIGRPQNPQDIKQITAAFTTASGIFQSTSGEVAKIRTELQGLQLGDEKLKGFQGRYATNLQQLETSLKSLGTVAQDLGKVKSQPELKTALTKAQGDLGQNLQQIPKTTQDAKQVESELNTYCEVKPTATPAAPSAAPPAAPAAPPK
jgi:chromosome segregation ATPase